MVDELINTFANQNSMEMADGAGDPETSGIAVHPRYSDYKNLGKHAAAQRERREQHLSRIRSDRQKALDIYRQIAKDLSQKSKENPFALKKKRQGTGKKQPHFAQILMLSDWLVDIPETLSSKWIMMPAPVGKRCLVVAHEGCTVVYDKRGKQFETIGSELPGDHVLPGKITMLDCIKLWNKENGLHTFYILDLICWASYYFDDQDFKFRQFWLQQKLNEDLVQPDEILEATDMSETLPSEFGKKPEPHKRCKFIQLPTCICEPQAMEVFMRSDFNFTLDGLLFYHSEAPYIHEQTPLVGWLLPWMLPEILNVTVPDNYFQGAYQNSQQFIDEFNEKSGHVSSAVKQKLVAEQAVSKKQEDME